jgi:hypothetical protein
MTENRDEVVSQCPRLEKMTYRSDREADYVADHHHSYAPRDDTRSEATYRHDIRDRVQRAVDRVLMTPQIRLTEGAEGVTPQVNLLGTTQRHCAGFTAVAGSQDGTFRLAG